MYATFRKLLFGAGSAVKGAEEAMINLDFAGKRALVCGSSQGIGYATAVLFAEHGAHVTLFARNAERLQQALETLPTTHSQQHHVLVADFQDTDAVAVTLRSYLAEQPVDIVVNNSGGPPPGLVIESSQEAFLRAFRQHLLANQTIVQLVLPHMQRQRFGRIINIISTSVREPIPGLGVSNTIRGAVASWAKTLSREVAPWNITVNNVLPGATDTQRLRQLIENKAQQTGKSVQDIRQQLLSEIPMGRFAEPREIAAAVLFLASDAASYITGVSLHVDGGRMRCL